MVAEAGLPIWITELDVRDDDVNIRADRYEDILRLYFSHEAIEGILLWGFWDQAHWRPECALAEGPDVTVCTLFSLKNVNNVLTFKLLEKNN